MLDYHDAHWTERVRALTGGVGVAAAANAARGGAAQAFATVANGGRLATITSDSARCGQRCHRPPGKCAARWCAAGCPRRTAGPR